MDIQENIPLGFAVAEVELIYRTQVKAAERPVIAKSKDAYDIFLSMWDKDKIELCEQFKVLFLNRGNKVLRAVSISTGGITGTVADPRHILIAALKLNATAVMLCHNHPSSNLKPSNADEELTRKIRCAANFFDILVLDHLIISPEGYYSFADEGAL